jgi:DNA repair protein RecN (Recombination protein N)
VYINGNLATLGMLSSLSERLVNICGQHEHQVMLKSDNHIDILDEFGGLQPLRQEFTRLYDDCLALKKRLEGLTVRNKQKREREELLAFQLKEIDSAAPVIGEDQQLLDEKKILVNAKKLRAYADESHDILYLREGAVLEQLSRVVSCVKEIQGIDSGLTVSSDDLDSLYYTLEETAFALRDYGKGLDINPERLEEIDNRLELLGSLKRKYGGSVESILERREKAATELRDISSLEKEIDCIAGEIADREEDLLGRAGDLSLKRHEAADQLKGAIEREIRSMRMEHTTFAVHFGHSAGEQESNSVMHAKGIDEVAFYLSTNVGETLKPLHRIASGGELSRIILAMKKVLAGVDAVGTVIFDEVDSGIGGAVAEVIGNTLRHVAEKHQVICITHLPQIACFGNAHFLVAKNVEGDRTNTTITPLESEQRLHEITRMLGGVAITERTREHAREMLERACKLRDVRC